VNKDFRVSVSITDHPKIIKLMRRLGDRAFFNLVRLWGYVAINKPGGNLAGVDAEDLEIAADWRGDPGIFVPALIDLGLLDNTNGTLVVHDWTEHNEFASYSKARSEKARNAARKRWNNKTKKEAMLDDATSNATSINEQCPDDAKSNFSNAPSPIPSPIPNPSPRDKKTLSCGTSADDSTSEEKKPLGKMAQAALDTYGDFARKFQDYVCREMGNVAPKITDALITNGAVIVDQLVRIDGFDFEDVRAALNWAVRDTFWRNQVLSLGGLRNKKNGAADQTKFQKIYTRYAESGEKPSGVVIYRKEDHPPGVMPDDAPPMMYDLNQIKKDLDAKGLGRVSRG
jgi:hypothetical protein